MRILHHTVVIVSQLHHASGGPRRQVPFQGDPYAVMHAIVTHPSQTILGLPFIVVPDAKTD